MFMVLNKAHVESEAKTNQRKLGPALERVFATLVVDGHLLRFREQVLAESRGPVQKSGTDDCCQDHYVDTC